MDHWLRTYTQAIDFIVKDGSPFSAIPKGLHFWERRPSISMGLLEVAFCEHSPITFGARSINLLTGLCYGHMTLWPISSIPITIYAFLPQLALLKRVSIFPEVCIPIYAVIDQLVL